MHMCVLFLFLCFIRSLSCTLFSYVLFKHHSLYWIFSNNFLCVSLLFVWIILLYRGSFERSIFVSIHCYCNWIFVFVRYIFLACIHFYFIINFRSLWIFNVLQMNFSITLLVFKLLFLFRPIFVVWLVYFFSQIICVLLSCRLVYIKSRNVVHLFSPILVICSAHIHTY